MKKYVFASLMLSCFTHFSNATDFTESFEGDGIPDGWTARSAQGSTKCVWSLENYSALNSKIGQPDDAGSKVAMSTTGGYSIVSGILPDSWLISPAVSIDGAAFLNFYYSYNLTYNSNSSLTDEQKAKFSVLVSTSGIEADDFTDELFFDVGAGLASWRQISLDVSKYAGKTIHIAFRNYNTEIHASASGMVTQRLYIDNVQVSDVAAYDIAVASCSDFGSGTVKSQPLTVSVRNYGQNVDKFEASYAINGGTAVTETVNHALKQGESYDYTFSQAPQFTTDGSQSVVVNVSIDNDKFTANNTLTKTLSIAAQGTFPFDLPSANTANDMVSTLSGTSTKPRGWQYFADDYNTWIYTEAGAPAYLYTATSFHLQPGAYSADFGYTCTSSTAQLDLYAFHVVGDFGSPIASKAIAQSVEEVTSSAMIFNIAEEGDYMFAFSVSGANKNEQVTLPELTLDVAATTPDITVNRILSPKGSVIGGSYKVTAMFSNNSGVDAANIPIKYTFNGESVTGSIEQIKAGESVTYTFDKKLTVGDAVADHKLTVQSELSGDSNPSNDALTATFSVYSPLSLPWRDSFEDDDATAQWTIVNVDNDMTYWGVTDQYSWDEDNLMYLNSFNSTKQDDWLISPALSINSAARLAFYYGNLSDTSASSKISIYLTRSIDPDEIEANGTLVYDFVDLASSINYFSQPLPQVNGTYYVAIHVVGGAEAFYIDDVRVDDASEAYAEKAECTAAEASYVVNDAEVKLTVVNGSAKTLTNVTVRYSVVDASGDNVVDDILEIIPQIAAGETTEYTFNQKISISAPGIYTVTASIAYLFDTDQRNNSITLPSFSVLAVKTVPYVATFEDDDDEYAISFGGKWERSTLGVYAGSAALNEYGKVADAENGDWAILHKLWLDAGTYDFSFFWRTSGGNTGDNYRKSFAIYLGSGPSVDKMSILLYEGKNVLNASELAQKELAAFTVDTDGYYYVGVKNTSLTTSGWIAVDDITIRKPLQGIVVGSGDEAYVSDIENNADQWYHYHPSSNIRQWTVATDDDGASYFKATESEDWSGNIQTASFIEAPAFNFEACNTYAITLTYAINPYLSTTELGSDNSLGLYVSTIDNPSTFAQIASFKTLQATTTETYKYVAQSSGLHYLAFRPSSADETVYSIYSLRVENTGETAVKTITFDTDAQAEYYTISGIRIAKPTAPGIYICRIGNATTKFVIK